MSNEYKFLFGPVPSRRFGRSLGVDLVPHKVCSTNCVFCEVGRTTQCTLERKEYVPTEVVVSELRTWLAAGGKTDFITLAGAGEPTLHTRFGEILEFVRANTAFRTAILTNSSLMDLPEVRAAAALADVVKISLSAWDQASFEAITRPHPSLRFDHIVEGLRLFRQQFKGSLWMEVFIVPGINSLPDDVRAIAAVAQTIQPDRIQLNTAVRPAAEESVFPLNADDLKKLAELFAPAAEVISSYHGQHQLSADQADGALILSMLRRRPCTANDIAHAFSVSEEQVRRVMDELVRAGHVRTDVTNGVCYFVVC